MNIGLSAVRRALGDDQPRPNEADRVLSYVGIRIAIGVAALILPFALYFSHFFYGSGRMPDSISGFYYTPMRNYFVGTLCALGIFFLCYRYAPRDNVLSSVVAALVVFVAFCPTSPPTGPDSPRSVFHLIAAALFFLLLAYFSYFLFTKTVTTHVGGTGPAAGLASGSTNPGERKLLRNKIYHACGVVILGALLLAAILSRTSIHLLFWWESIAVAAFSFSWLVKGGLLFADRPSLDVESGPAQTDPGASPGRP
jgi:hypothetical protein